MNLATLRDRVFIYFMNNFSKYVCTHNTQICVCSLFNLACKQCAATININKISHYMHVV